MKGFCFLFVFCLLQFTLCQSKNPSEVDVNDIEELNACSFPKVNETLLRSWYFPYTPDVIWSATSYLLKYPWLSDIAIKAMNIICSAAQHISSEEPSYVPNMAKLHYVTLDGAKFPLDEPTAIWSHLKFDPNMPTVMLITGWLTDSGIPNEALEEISKAYKCRGGYNFVSVDTGGLLSNLYIWSSFNTDVVGKAIAESLTHLTKTKSYPVEKIHLIGHSLGAQIAGSVGRHFYKKTNTLIHHITGLDPARPCFNEGEKLTGLSRGDAIFIDVIHTNNDILGKKDPIGDVDFYPNGVTTLQPGCFSSTICSHMRAPALYAETVYPKFENNFMAVRCNSISSLDNGFCTEKPVAMGYAVPKEAKGTFMLKTKDHKPFGQFAPINTNPECVDGFTYTP